MTEKDRKRLNEYAPRIDTHQASILQRYIDDWGRDHGVRRMEWFKELATELETLVEACGYEDCKNEPINYGGN